MYRDKFAIIWDEHERSIGYENYTTRLVDFGVLDENKKIIGILDKLIIWESSRMNCKERSKFFKMFDSIVSMTLYKATISDLPTPILLSTLEALNITHDCGILKCSRRKASLAFREMNRLTSINIGAEEENIKMRPIIVLFSVYGNEPPVAEIHFTSFRKVLRALAGKKSSFQKYAKLKIQAVSFYINRIDRIIEFVISKKVDYRFPMAYMHLIYHKHFDKGTVFYQDTYERFFLHWNGALKKYDGKLKYRKWRKGENGKIVLYPEEKTKIGQIEPEKSEQQNTESEIVEQQKSVDRHQPNAAPSEHSP